ncbi:MAG TPA: 50S ribosomal protein L4 [Dehalococcoidia bacterium]|nr:50S ribosomal protein L4 [Dehalococcoidia bacterium]
MRVPVYNISGEVVKNIDIADSVFAVPANEAVVYQALVRQLANARQGTASSKTRSEVAGSKQKMYRQKHTGRSRAGSLRSPLRRGGGITFGPKPRDYRQSMPRSMRRLAIRCVLSAKVSGNELMVLDELKFREPKTKEMANVLSALSVADSTLIAISSPEANIVKSARNLPGVKTIPARQLNVVDVISYKKLLMTEEAVRQVEELWGKEMPQEAKQEVSQETSDASV